MSEVKRNTSKVHAIVLENFTVLHATRPSEAVIISPLVVARCESLWMGAQALQGLRDCLLVS